jgi:hypothetical protein
MLVPWPSLIYRVVFNGEVSGATDTYTIGVLACRTPRDLGLGP